MLVFSFFSGAAIGALYFTGLWWTVTHLGDTRRPGRRVLASFLLRTALSLGGFYVVMQGRPERLVLCLLGFMMVRWLAVRRIRMAGGAASRVEKEEGIA